jgi:hypothetical protein
MATSVQVNRAQLEKQIKDRSATKGPKRGPTYIMNGSDGYYDAAERYYDKWGYRPVKAASFSHIAQMVAKSSGSLETVRIVSHGAPNTSEQSMQMPVLKPGKEPPQAGQVRTERPQLLLADPTIFASKHLEEILGTFMDTHFSFTKMSDPTLRMGQDAGLMAPSSVTNGRPTSIATTGEFAWGTEQTAFAAIAVLELITKYRAVQQGGAIATKDLDRLEATFRDLRDYAIFYSRAEKSWEALQFISLFEQEVDTLVPPNPEPLLQEILGKFKQIEQVDEEMKGGGDFAETLNRARAKLSNGTEIEIRGCNVGRDQVFMNRMQDFFGVPGGRAPAVSAPKLYQVYTNMRVTTIGSNEDHQRTTSSNKLTKDAQALLHDDMAVNMNDAPRPLEDVLKDYHSGEMSRLGEAAAARWRGQNFSVKKIRALNPPLRELKKEGGFRDLKPFERFRLSDAAPGLSATGAVDIKWHLKRTLIPDAPLDQFAFNTELSVRDVDTADTLQEWVRTVLAERHATISGVPKELPIMFLTYSMDNSTDAGEPGLFAGQMQFWRHINYTPPR